MTSRAQQRLVVIGNGMASGRALERLFETASAQGAGPLSEGIVHDCKVTCPRHNRVIGLADGHAIGADQGCARSFAAKLDKGRIYLEASVATVP